VLQCMHTETLETGLSTQAGEWLADSALQPLQGSGRALLDWLAPRAGTHTTWTPLPNIDMPRRES